MGNLKADYHYHRAQALFEAVGDTESAKIAAGRLQTLTLEQITGIVLDD